MRLAVLYRRLFDWTSTWQSFNHSLNRTFRQKSCCTASPRWTVPINGLVDLSLVFNGTDIAINPVHHQRHSNHNATSCHRSTNQPIAALLRVALVRLQNLLWLELSSLMNSRVLQSFTQTISSWSRSQKLLIRHSLTNQAWYYINWSASYPPAVSHH